MSNNNNFILLVNIRINVITSSEIDDAIHNSDIGDKCDRANLKADAAPAQNRIVKKV